MDQRGAVLHESVRFRRDFGLPRDRAHVAAVEAGAAWNRDYGVALTPAEAKIIDERFEVSDAMGVIANYVKDSAAGVFGGAYIDQTRGGTVYVGPAYPVRSGCAGMAITRRCGTVAAAPTLSQPSGG